MLFSILLILGQFDQKGYKYLEASHFTDLHGYDSNILYKNEEGGSPSNVIIYFRFRNNSFTFSQQVHVTFKNDTGLRNLLQKFHSQSPSIYQH